MWERVNKSFRFIWGLPLQCVTATIHYHNFPINWQRSIWNRSMTAEVYFPCTSSIILFDFNTVTFPQTTNLQKWSSKTYQGWYGKISIWKWKYIWTELKISVKNKKLPILPQFFSKVYRQVKICLYVRKGYIQSQPWTVVNPKWNINLI